MSGRTSELKFNNKYVKLVSLLLSAYTTGTKINVFVIVATRAPKISDLRARSKFW